MRPIVDPRMLGRIKGVFLQTCTIQTKTETKDAYQQPILSWPNLAGHVGLPCQVSPNKKPFEQRTATETFIRLTHTIGIPGAYPDIEAGMRAVVGTDTYEIILPKVDSQAVMTWLDAEIVE